MIIRGRQAAKQDVCGAHGSARYAARAALVIAAAMFLLLGAGAALAGSNGNFCTDTTRALRDACKHEVSDDFLKAKAICINVSDQQEREACLAEARTERADGNKLCGEQRMARRELCLALGEDRYDPDFDPANFDSDFGSLTNPNRYIQLAIGNHWEYAGGDETIEIDVLNKTKLIEGVTCIVVQDRVSKSGELVEDTDDWFAQAKNGDVYYCGEEVKDYESFTGDNPKEPELVSTDGSFKWGRDGDKGGIFFLGLPTVGAVYRQEFSAGNAEDAVRVLSTTYGYGSDPELDQFVPQALAERFCLANDCVVTGEFSPLHPDPDGFARKYYAQGIGVFLEVVPATGDIVQLVNCNFDARCVSLPAP